MLYGSIYLYLCVYVKGNHRFQMLREIIYMKYDHVKYKKLICRDFEPREKMGQ
jgi:hypothetical protein